MNAPPRVRRADAREIDIVARVLTDAFPDEAGLNWWLRQGVQKERARRAFFDFAVREGVSPRRELWLAEADVQAPLGAAIWLPAGAHAFATSAFGEVMRLPFFLSVAGFSGMRRAQALGAELAAHHPSAPHAHLVFLGVAPKAQGLGIGSAILKTTLREVDAAGLPAYLEASTERNVALYQRHGFEVTAAFDVKGGGPRMYAMTRPARA